MQKENGGFTLVELLVVVLIIGILAAVALPQYQKAVEKSKATQALTMLKSVYQAAKAYSLANGNWPTSFDELAVDIPWTGTTAWQQTGQPTKSNADWSIQLNTCNGMGVTVGRISGPFRGGAFGIFETPNTSAGSEELPRDEIVCIEGHAANSITNVSSNVRGNYCKKWFKGTLILTGHANNYYRLP